MALIKFFMIEWILNFSIYTKATLEVQLSKHSDITGDKMMTVFATSVSHWNYFASWGFLPLSFFNIKQSRKSWKHCCGATGW